MRGLYFENKVQTWNKESDVGNVHPSSMSSGLFLCCKFSFNPSCHKELHLSCWMHVWHGVEEMAWPLRLDMSVTSQWYLSCLSIYQKLTLFLAQSIYFTVCRMLRGWVEGYRNEWTNLFEIPELLYFSFMALGRLPKLSEFLICKIGEIILHSWKK